MQQFVPVRPYDDNSNPFDNVETIWFEFDAIASGWGVMYLGFDTGSRGLTQTLRITLSDVFDPLPELAQFAEAAVAGDLPARLEIDSEGPETAITLSQSVAPDKALLDIRDLCSPVVYLAAIVDARQAGLALAWALKSAAENPRLKPVWDRWDPHIDRIPDYAEAYFGNAWLRELTFDEHPSGEWSYAEVDTANQRRFPMM